MAWRARNWRRVVAIVATAVALVAAGVAGWQWSRGPGPSPPVDDTDGVATEPAFDEPFRPQFHYSPERGWMNDPNGLVLVDDTYHFYYQHNPDAPVWGDISWGHATSEDLVHWDELPVAIRGTPEERIFSGSVVLDAHNTSGLGTAQDPPLVALYTSWYEATSGHQAQSVAYSTDGGLNWARYAGNPVLTARAVGRDPREFRDPKVFWDPRFERWVMVVAYPVDRQVGIFTSQDLLTWQHQSDFGPAGATGGVWECPDLFELRVDGDPARTRWVMSVSLNPGGPNGGSAAQYFVGDFDGETFRPDEQRPDRPDGEIIADFNGSYPADWVREGDAFDAVPASGARPGQNEVTGFSGSGLASSFTAVDAATGGGDPVTGTLTSPPVRVTKDYLSFLVGGGSGDGTAVQLVVGDEVVRRASGVDSEELVWVSWNVSDLRGQLVQVRLVDRARGPWGHLLADELMLSDRPATRTVHGGRWQDYGRDYYAVVSWNGTPPDRRTVIGWMSNWDYANDVPTAPWRSAATLPRILELQSRDGVPALIQTPVRPTIEEGAETLRIPATRVAAGDVKVLGAHPAAARIVVELDLSSADEAGLEVLAGDSAETVIGYDTGRQELYLDRTRSGRTDFHPSFASVDRAPLAVEDGRLSMEIYIDHSSVEVFAEGGLVTMTAQVFPPPRSDELRAYSSGGTAAIEHLSVERVPASR